MPVAMVPPPRGGLAFEMVVEFGVENTLGKRLLQLLEKPVLVETSFGSRPSRSWSRVSFLIAISALRWRHYGPAHKIPYSPAPLGRHCRRRRGRFILSTSRGSRSASAFDASAPPCSLTGLEHTERRSPPRAKLPHAR